MRFAERVKQNNANDWSNQKNTNEMTQTQKVKKRRGSTRWGGKLAVVRYRLKKNIIREGNRHVGGLVEGLKVLKVWWVPCRIALP